MVGLKQRDLKLGLLNARSLNTGQDELIVSVHKYKPDILALNETWMKEGQEKYAVRISGYHLKHTPRGSRAGGVGFFVRRGLRVLVRDHPPSPLEQM